MSKLNELIQELCPDGVEYKTIGELFDVANGYTPSKNNNEYWENGTIPWFRMEDLRQNGTILDDAVQHINIKGARRIFSKNSLILATTATIGVHALIIKDFVCNQQLTACTLKEKYKNSLDIKFYYYYFDLVDKECIKIANQGGGMPIVSLSKLKELFVPVPPIEVQREIVRILDNFTEQVEQLKSELNAELDARKKQYEYYQDNLLTFDEDVPVVALSDIAQYSKDRIDSDSVDANSYVGVDNLLQMKKGKVRSSCVPTSGRLTKYHKNDILIGNIRPYLRKIWIADNDGGTNGDVLTIQIISDKVNPKYLFAQLSSEAFFNYDTQNSKGAKMPRGDKDAVMRYPIPVPLIEEQERIVALLERYESYYNEVTNNLRLEIEARQKQYEYYRDKILLFGAVN